MSHPVEEVLPAGPRALAGGLSLYRHYLRAKLKEPVRSISETERPIPKEHHPFHRDRKGPPSLKVRLP